MKIRMKEKLNSYYAEESVTLLLGVCSFMDPRFMLSSSKVSDNEQSEQILTKVNCLCCVLVTTAQKIVMIQEVDYQFNCLPYGLSSAPWVFTKTLKDNVAGVFGEEHL